MGTRDNLDICYDISERILAIREKSGFSRLEMARHLHKRWNIYVLSTLNYITSLEMNFFLCLENRKSYNILDVHEKRISDYLFSLGSSKEEIEDIFKDIKKIRPEFKLLQSDVVVYKNSLKT